jgi:hypothetical protein
MVDFSRFVLAPPPSSGPAFKGLRKDMTAMRDQEARAQYYKDLIAQQQKDREFEQGKETTRATELQQQFDYNKSKAAFAWLEKNQPKWWDPQQRAGVEAAGAELGFYWNEKGELTYKPTTTEGQPITQQGAQSPVPRPGAPMPDQPPASDAAEGKIVGMKRDLGIPEDMPVNEAKLLQIAQRAQAGEDVSEDVQFLMAEGARQATEITSPSTTLTPEQEQALLRELESMPGSAMSMAEQISRPAMVTRPGDPAGAAETHKVTTPGGRTLEFDMTNPYAEPGEVLPEYVPKKQRIEFDMTNPYEEVSPSATRSTVDAPITSAGRTLGAGEITPPEVMYSEVTPEPMDELDAFIGREAAGVEQELAPAPGEYVPEADMAFTLEEADFGTDDPKVAAAVQDKFAMPAGEVGAALTPSADGKGTDVSYEGKKIVRLRRATPQSQAMLVEAAMDAVLSGTREGMGDAVRLLHEATGDVKESFNMVRDSAAFKALYAQKKRAGGGRRGTGGRKRNPIDVERGRKAAIQMVGSVKEVAGLRKAAEDISTRVRKIDAHLSGKKLMSGIELIDLMFAVARAREPGNPRLTNQDLQLAEGLKTVWGKLKDSLSKNFGITWQDATYDEKGNRIGGTQRSALIKAQGAMSPDVIKSMRTSFITSLRARKRELKRVEERLNAYADQDKGVPGMEDHHYGVTTARNLLFPQGGSDSSSTATPSAPEATTPESPTEKLFKERMGK